MKNIIYLVALFLLASSQMVGQDIHFSQYNFSPLTLNPALTSAYKDIQATLNYKQQWHSMNCFTTAEATFESKLNIKSWIKLEKLTETYKKKLVQGLAFGINVYSDKAGDGSMKTTQENLSMAYHALLGPKSTLSAGIMGGIVQRGIDPSKLRWNSQYAGGNYDPSSLPDENFSNQSFVYGDYSAGLLYSYGDANSYPAENNQKFFNAGVSVSHLNQPNQSFLSTSSDMLNRRWVFHTSGLIGIKNTHYSIAPSFLYAQQGSLKEIVLGGMIKYKMKEASQYTGINKSTIFSLGCYYRNKDAVIPYFLLEMDKFTLGLSYDTNISGLMHATSGRGGIEICLRFGNGNAFLYQNSKSLF